MTGCLSVESLCAGYAKKEVLKGISLCFEKGHITTVIGPNGSGKSTLLKTAGRLLRPFSGEVLLEGKSIAGMDDRSIAKKIGILPQSPAAPMDLPVHCLVAFGRTPHHGFMNRFTNEDRDAVDWAIESTGLADKRFKRIGQLSGGERQRAWIAMSLAQKPEILLFDEPTTYLDIHHQFEVLELLRRLNDEHGLTVVMVLHDLNLAASFSHRIVALKDGVTVADGTPEDVLSVENISRVFNIRSKIIRINEEGIEKTVAVPLGVRH
ncbi:ABC transporter ATP-binding protein [Geovibrio thiophilus]|uniref:ABC transporter ATP-binding protein n=1 Tax=Geovibrio thiophilus TaxID=139438 RepID=A0A3R5UY96_9BACT|nr:ABC transporter ATP-binding protein [Geovibrio thiophilus]QAR33421.1 ABC transporter ATP-binding protein [Geovibrio thiophilus]